MNKNSIELTCIVCPNGCRLSVLLEEGRVETVDNALCPKGKEYAIRELVDPRRILTTTVKVADGEIPLVSVRTDTAIPKHLMREAVRLLSALDVNAPVEAGALIVDNLLNTGAKAIATKCVSRKTS